MGKILTIHQIPGAIIDLIEETRDYCYLVTPYYQPWAVLERALKKASAQQKKLVFIFRAGSLTPEMKSLNEEYGFEVIMVHKLHTKLYLNERKAIISSMNLYGTSKENNYELGYVIEESRTVRELRDKIIDDDILGLEPALHLRAKGLAALRKSQERAAAEQHLEREDLRRANYDEKHENAGYCIRCAKRIPHNPAFPLCERCYEMWSRYMNPDYQENYCHTCGRKADTSKSQPHCSRCRPRTGFFQRLGL